MLTFIFPEFNLYSTSLLILVGQGIIFSILLLHRYRISGRLSDLLLAIIILITCFHRTTYIIGFMGWYDTFRNTKINYYLPDLTLLLAPMLYFYVKSVTRSNFQFSKKQLIHFAPIFVFVLIAIFIFAYDSIQPGFADVQNGVLKQNLDRNIVDPLHVIISFGSMLLYLAFTFQLLHLYKKRINDLFSNTYKLELNWLLNFLIVYTALFVYSFIQTFIHTTLIELSWIERWWFHLVSSIAILYISIKGYFTDTSTLDLLKKGMGTSASENLSAANLSIEQNQELKDQVVEYMTKNKPYLQSEFTLVEMARELKMNRNTLSDLINSGFGQNFNDFINQYRVNEVKVKIKDPANQHLTLLSIAEDSGFNSKATFNRVFKKITGASPSGYRKTV